MHDASRLHFSVSMLPAARHKQQRDTLAGLQIVALEADRWQAVLHCSRVQVGASADRRSAARHQRYSQAGSAAAGCQMRTGMAPLTSAKLKLDLFAVFLGVV